jgi:hypothetical protein
MITKLVGIVTARTPPTIMIVVGAFGWMGESAINSVFGISAIPVVGCILLIVGGVAIHLLELFLHV